MKKTAIRSVVLAALLSPWAFAQSPLTVVSDTITYADGSHPSGRAVISWGRGLNDADPRQVIAAGSTTILINNGVVSVSLFPNAATLPPGTCFSVAYQWTTGGPPVRRYWYIPISSVPVTLQQIEGSIPCPTTSPVTVAPGQIVPGAAGVTQVLTSSPSGFVSWATGGGSGGSPGGTNGQVQYNNLGSFGGFTPAGDCVLSRPNFVCTSTNGVPFASSATTDTTNASNISSGTLDNGRLSAVPNSALANSSITVNTTSPLSGGGTVALGGSLTLACPTCSGVSTITLTGDVNGSGSSSIPTTIVNISPGAALTYLTPTLVSAPGTPPSGSGYLYVDTSSGNLALKNSSRRGQSRRSNARCSHEQLCHGTERRRGSVGGTTAVLGFIQCGGELLDRYDQRFEHLKWHPGGRAPSGHQSGCLGSGRRNRQPARHESQRRQRAPVDPHSGPETEHGSRPLALEP